jgi:uncharacterized membrane protein YccC
MSLKIYIIILVCLLALDIVLTYFLPKEWNLLITALTIITAFCLMGFSLRNINEIKVKEK